MLRVPKSVLIAGGVFLGAGLMLLANPKTVHAIAAAMVQVTNTSSNPVVTQSVGRQAAQIVEVWCTGDEGGTGCYQILPDSTLAGGTYSVPTGQSLVITSADLAVYKSAYPFPPPVPCAVFSEVDLASPTVREAYFVSAGSGTQHYTYPAGIVVGPGIGISSQIDVSSCAFRLELHGYLTAN